MSTFEVVYLFLCHHVRHSGLKRAADHALVGILILLFVDMLWLAGVDGARFGAQG